MKYSDTLAKDFRRVIREWLKADQVELVNERNARSNDDSCATHDYCDANMAMHEAFVSTFGREPNTEDGGDLRLWNEAWDTAKRRGF